MFSDRMSDARELARLWQAVLGRLELDLLPHTFDTWLRHTRAFYVENDTIVVEAARAFDVEHLRDRLAIVVQQAVYDIAGPNIGVEFIPPAKGAQWAGPTAAAPVAAQRRGQLIGAINQRFTFSSYLPASGNRLAYECARGLLDDGANQPSPLVVYGTPGMGKTHLLHAVAAEALEKGWNVASLSAEEFTSRYQSALRNRSVEEFQSELRAVRLLVLDDLQYLSGKRGTQDELVHTMDAIANAGGHVAVGSERHPYDLELHERLASRLSAGVVAQVEPFLPEERRTFIEMVGRRARLSLPSWAVDRISQAEVRSVRVLQGALNAAIALAGVGMLELGRLDAELARVSITDAGSPCPDRAVVESVARYFETTFDDVVGRSRRGSLGQARAVAVLALRERGRSLSEIAELLGGRDKSTISPLVERGRELVAAQPDLRRALSA